MKKKLFALLPAVLKRQLKKAYYFKKFSKAQWNQEPDLGFLKTMVKPGAVVLDVGANYGLYTRFLSELVGVQGLVIALEPVQETFDIIDYNVQKSKLKQVQVMPLAASDTEGQAEVFIPTWEDGTDNFYEASLSATATTMRGRKLTIQTTRLDALGKDFSRLDFIKLDVEGHEPEALKGATTLIQKFRPVMLIEINDHFQEGTPGAKVLAFMKSLDYDMFALKNEALVPVDGKADGVNYWFIPKEKGSV